MKKRILYVAMLSFVYVTVNAQVFNPADNHSTLKERKQQKILSLLKKGYATSYKTKHTTESKIDSITFEIQVDGEWQLSSVVNFSYSEENPQETSSMKIFYDGNWTPIQKNELYVNSENRIDSTLDYEYFEGEYVLTGYEKFFYDSEQRLDSVHNYGFYADDDFYDEYYVFTHSSADSILFTYNYNGLEFGAAVTETGQGYLINRDSNLYQFFENNIGTKSRAIYFDYSFDELVNPANDITMYVSFEYAEWSNDDYIPVEKSTFVYNEDVTQLVSGKDQMFMNGSWEDITDYIFNYNNNLLSVIETTEYDGDDLYKSRQLISYKNITSNDQELKLTGYKLSQNYPNPFNPNTIIKYSIPVSSNVSIEIYNMLGQKMSTILNEFKKEGPHEIKFDASSLPSGVYMYRLKADAFVETKLMTLIK